jgi:hypothetical protein
VCSASRAHTVVFSEPGKLTMREPLANSALRIDSATKGGAVPNLAPGAIELAARIAAGGHRNKDADQDRRDRGCIEGGMIFRSRGSGHSPLARLATSRGVMN